MLGRHHALTPEVVPGIGEVKGGIIDKEIVRRIVRRHINEVRYCYEQGLTRHPGLGGRIVVQFMISGKGQVLSSVMQSTTISDVAVQSCVVQAVRRWEFPAPSGGGLVQVSYPFQFQPAGGGL
jgi:TonB family protein